VERGVEEWEDVKSVSNIGVWNEEQKQDVERVQRLGERGHRQG